jgi:hypothetical protein
MEIFICVEERIPGRLKQELIGSIGAGEAQQKFNQPANRWQYECEQSQSVAIGIST